MVFRIIKIIATTPGKRGTLVFAAGLAVVTGPYWGIEKMVIPGHDAEVMKRYPASKPGLEGICVRLDEAATS